MIPFYVFCIIIAITIFCKLYICQTNCKYDNYMLNSTQIPTTQIHYIPKIIIQTYISRDKVPQKVFDNIKKFAPNYKHYFFSHDDRLKFIKNNYDNSVVDAYNNTKNMAHQADLFRYCYLYIHGGVYLDIKIELIKPLDEIFKENYTYTALSIVRNSVCQGIIATPPKNKLFLNLINFFKEIQGNIAYHTFTKDFYSKVKDDINSELKEGLNVGKNMNYYLFREKCTHNKSDCYDGLDNKGLCCYIYDNNEPIIKVRYSDYPW